MSDTSKETDDTAKCTVTKKTDNVTEIIKQASVIGVVGNSFLFLAGATEAITLLTDVDATIAAKTVFSAALKLELIGNLKEFEPFEEEATALETTIEATKNNIDALNNTVTATTTQIANIKTDIDACATKLDGTQASITAAQTATNIDTTNAIAVATQALVNQTRALTAAVESIATTAAANANQVRTTSAITQVTSTNTMQSALDVSL